MVNRVAAIAVLSVAGTSCIGNGFGNGGGVTAFTAVPKIPSVTRPSTPLQSTFRKSLTEPTPQRWSTRLYQSDPTVNELQNEESEYRDFADMVQNDPLNQEIRRFQNMEVNAMINSSIIVILAVAVLSKFATVDYGMMRGWTASEVAMRIPVDNWLSYTSVLDRAPVYTKAVTSATVYTIGDFIAQRTEGKDMGEIDRARILRSLLAGLIGHGPLSHVWYDVSENLFTDVLHWTAWWSFFPKVVLDQTTWAPIWNNSYILMLGLMKMDKLETIWADIKRTTVPLIVSGLKLWPLAHCVTYGLIPLENRLLWVDLVEILWVTILATQAAGGGPHDAAVEGELKSTDNEKEQQRETVEQR